MNHYHTILLDFDGLLVNTEPLHYAAYMRLAEQIGCPLSWDFAQFCQEAHSQEGGFFEGLKREYPDVFQKEHSKASLYEEKKRLYVELLKNESLSLMPGVEDLLLELQKREVKRAVVTNSPKNQIELIQSKLPTLQTLPLWITREDYREPKPSPEGYLLALSKLSSSPQEAVGFEDTLKGIRSLLAAQVRAVLVAPSDYGSVKVCKQLGAEHIEQLSDFFSK